jgi:protein involved in polysaccharide export with SLBB domain
VPFTRDDTLLDALTRDGGLAPNGDPDKVSLLRPGHAPVTVSVKKMFKEGDLTNNLPLQVGDTVVVAELHRDVYVFGYVSAPGKYTFQEDDRVLDIIARTGVAYGTAAPWESALIRRKGINVEVYVLDLDKLMHGQRQDMNYLLENGDIIFVPKRKGTNWLEWVQQAFSWYGLVSIFRPGG